VNGIGEVYVKSVSRVIAAVPGSVKRPSGSGNRRVGDRDLLGVLAFMPENERNQRGGCNQSRRREGFTQHVREYTVRQVHDRPVS